MLRGWILYHFRFLGFSSKKIAIVLCFVFLFAGWLILAGFCLGCVFGFGLRFTYSLLFSQYQSAWSFFVFLFNLRNRSSRIFCLFHLFSSFDRATIPIPFSFFRAMDHDYYDDAQVHIAQAAGKQSIQIVTESKIKQKTPFLPYCPILVLYSDSIA